MITAPHPFYLTEKVLPPLRVMVWVFWGGRGPFEASRVEHPRTKAQCWLTHDDGRPVFLPCKTRADRDAAPWVGWHTLEGDQPEAWSPKLPAKWGLALPEPQFIYQPPPPSKARRTNRPPIEIYRETGRGGPSFDNTRFATERQSFNAAEAAAEMEADRDRARNGGEAKPAQPRRKLWWLDSSQITYSPPGRRTRREVEGRLMRALASESFGSESDGLGMHRLTPDDMRELAEIEADTLPELRARFTSTPDDGRDYLEAIRWFSALSFSYGDDGADLGRCSGRLKFAPLNCTNLFQERQRVLIFAARDVALSFGDIGIAMAGKKADGKREKPRSRQATRDLYLAALERVWTIANDAADPGVIAQRDALKTLQEGNRAARV